MESKGEKIRIYSKIITLIGDILFDRVMRDGCNFPTGILGETS